MASEQPLPLSFVRSGIVAIVAFLLFAPAALRAARLMSVALASSRRGEGLFVSEVGAHCEALSGVTAACRLFSCAFQLGTTTLSGADGCVS